jgi:uncharacterized protein (DUF2141 family)
MRKLAFAITAAATLVTATAAVAGELRIRLHGVESSEGKVRLALFRGQAAFEADERTAGVFVPANPEGVDVVLLDLPADTYAISTFHDRNDNSELDRNLVGMPVEAFGFSNDARGSFGPPSFEKMSFVVGDAPVALEIHLR